jgi:thymidylate synthase (FAD)
MKIEIPVLDHGFVRYIDHMGSDLRVVEAARVSYQSPSKGDEADKKLLHYLLKNKHTSPFEMCKITFNIRMPIFVMRQFIRHRMQNVNEVSARYSVLPEEFYTPNFWRKQDTKNKQGSVEAELDHKALGIQLQDAYKHCYVCYEQLLHQGVAKEMARLILPVGIYTEIYSCWDMNNLLKYFILRDDVHAQWEHQQFAFAMKKVTAQIFPWIMEAYEQHLNPHTIKQ